MSQVSRTVFSKLSKIFIRNCHQKLSSEIVTKNCHQKMSSKIVSQVMSPHHSDQMSQWLQVSRIALYMAKVKVSQSVSDKFTYWAVLNSKTQFFGHLPLRIHFVHCISSDWFRSLWLYVAKTWVLKMRICCASSCRAYLRPATFLMLETRTKTFFNLGILIFWKYSKFLLHRKQPELLLLVGFEKVRGKENFEDVAQVVT